MFSKILCGLFGMNILYYKLITFYLINEKYNCNDNIEYAEIIDGFLYLSDYEFAKNIDTLNKLDIHRILNCGGKGLEMEFNRVKWPNNFKRKVINVIEQDHYPIIDKHGIKKSIQIH